MHSNTLPSVNSFNESHSAVKKKVVKQREAAIRAVCAVHTYSLRSQLRRQSGLLKMYIEELDIVT